MIKLKKNDTVSIITGKDRGKTGKVLAVLPKRERVIIEGINFVKKHMRKTRDDQQGGVIKKEAPMHVSNIALFCKGCNRPTKVGVNLLKDGSKSRFCKRCKEVF